MIKVIKFVKKEAVLFISLAAALISMIFTPPNPEYLGYVDWSTLGLLFCLMAAVQGFGSIGAFSRLAGTLTRRFHSTRSLGAALVLMCFFLAMLVTNDVSLLTLVPLTIALFRSMPEVCIRTVVLEILRQTSAPWLPRWGIRRISIFTRISACRSRISSG